MNQEGGLYQQGIPFDKAKWMSIIIKYRAIVESEGSCSERRLMKEAQISKGTASKAIHLAHQGLQEPAPRGHGRRGVGVLIGTEPFHDAFIYRLYRENPMRPIDDYVVKLNEEFNLRVSRSFISRWFKEIGSFKGTMRKTSVFPPQKHSLECQELVRQYLTFIRGLGKHGNVFFADEKLVKGKDIYHRVRRDPIEGVVPTIPSDAANTMRNRWNIMAICSIKRSVRALQYIMVEEKGDSILFQFFIRELLRSGYLRPGDILVLDNCTIHMGGENEFLQEVLWMEHGILLLPLPPYHPELNPIELIFNDLVQNLRSNAARFVSLSQEDFNYEVRNFLSNVTHEQVERKYIHRGYVV